MAGMSTRGRTPSAAPAWSCRSRWSAPRRRSGSRRAPRPATDIAGCGRASRSAACRSPGSGGPGTRAGCRPRRGCRPAPAGELEMVPVAGCEVGAGLRDADDRPARLQLVPGQPEVQIALQVERRHVGLLVVVPPVLATQPPLALIRHHQPRRLAARPGRRRDVLNSFQGRGVKPYGVALSRASAAGPWISPAHTVGARRHSRNMFR